jgi:CRP-like cAMP-binding protein
VQHLEAVLGTVSIFSHLRADEVGRIAKAVSRVRLGAGERYAMPGTSGASRLLIVVSGQLDAVLEDPTGELHELMRPGDRYGEAMLLMETPKAVSVTARVPSEIALLDRATLTSILREIPAVALPLAAELASELRARNDQVRRLAELLGSDFDKAKLERSIRQLKQSLVSRCVGVRRASWSGIFRRLVIDRGGELHFWMLVGFLGGLTSARIVVHFIVKYHLEREFCALVAGRGPNPMHIHHFNYGLAIVGGVALLAFAPWGRRSLRALALLFGLGCGLIFDEFALFWYLRPDYYQGLSLISAAIVGALLVQLAYFRRFWLALLGRFVPRIHSE